MIMGYLSPVAVDAHSLPAGSIGARIFPRRIIARPATEISHLVAGRAGAHRSLP